MLAPGLAWHYSNLASHYSARSWNASRGSPYRRYVEERLLGPVGLATTGWECRRGERGRLPGRRLRRLRLRRAARGHARHLRRTAWSTVGDLCRWGSFLAEPDPDVLRPETAAEMRSVQVMAEPERWMLAWGLGLALYRRDDRVYAGHDGAMPGHLAAFSFRPQERLPSPC